MFLRVRGHTVYVSTNSFEERKFTVIQLLLSSNVRPLLAGSDGPSGRVLLEHDAAPAAPEQPAAGERATGAVLGAPPVRPAPAASVPLLPPALRPGALRGPAQADCGPRTFFLTAERPVRSDTLLTHALRLPGVACLSGQRQASSATLMLASLPGAGTKCSGRRQAGTTWSLPALGMA